jgi:predicted DNA-binding transcriptional regulator AlpA
MSSSEIEELIGVSKQTIHRWEKSENFPKRINLGPRKGGWNRKEVMEWLESKGIIFDSTAPN